MNKSDKPGAGGVTRSEFLHLGVAAAAASAFVPQRLSASTESSGLREIEAVHRKRLSSPQVDLLERGGLKLVWGDRQGARVQCAHTGRWYWDCHRLGSTYNVGHRHPKIIEALRRGIAELEIGNFMMLSSYRSKLAETLAKLTGDRLSGIVFTTSGAEANEAAMKAARVASGRRKFVCFEGGYHGDTLGTLAVGGDAQKRELYQLEDADITFVPFNDLEAAKAAITTETAALIAEPTVAQLGFPPPEAGYWKALAEHCQSVGAYTIIDEVQTGGSATGTFWHYQQLDFVPDMLVNGKWSSGGYFPNSFLMLRQDIHEAFTRGVFMPHPSTFGGSELGCLVTSATIEILADPALQANVRQLSELFAEGLADVPFRLNQNGLCMAIIDERRDNFSTVRLLADEGIITIPALHDPHAVEFRPILTLTRGEAEQIIALVRKALG